MGRQRNRYSLSGELVILLDVLAPRFLLLAGVKDSLGEGAPCFLLTGDDRLVIY